MPDLRDKLPELIQRYERDRTKPRTEADVSANFIDHLFAALGWDVTNPNEYNRQRYVREAGFADIGLLLRGEPRLFVEVKRFGQIPKSTERTGDRTPEEKQAFKYARQEKIKWAVLTNFERLHVFDADQERLILAFDDPQDYARRIEDLNRLAKANIERDSLEHFGQLQAKEDLDRGFLESLKRWRKLLAQDILDRNPDNEVLLSDGHPDLDKLRRVVQRILDRLVIIRYADDRELLDDFGVIEAMHAGFKARRSYAAEGKLYRDFLDFCAGMDRKHNTEIFSPKHPCEQVTVSNDCLDQILAEITTISFRKFTSDVLGNTYETYLGHRLQLKDGRIELAERRDLRKEAGIYYTPRPIVRYIVDNTLGRKLEELKAQHGLNAGHEARKLKVLDPACGSGSFLIYAFDVLAKFYESCNERVTAENTRLLKESKPGEQLETQAAVKSLPKRLYHFPKIILEENLYGVDLDDEAAELASVNLIMKAFDRVSSNGRKLPLILNQNIKVGNSLIGYVPGVKLWEKTTLTAKDLKPLIELRQQVRETDDDTTKRKLLDEATDRTRQAAASLNEPLKKFFRDPAIKHPFHWPVEFPEVFANGDGFDIVIGNPPWGADIQPDEKTFFKQVWLTAESKCDTYILFEEAALARLRTDGELGFIIPYSWVSLQDASVLRKILLSTCQIRDIAYLHKIAFPHVDNDSTIQLTHKVLSDRISQKPISSKLTTRVLKRDGTLKNIEEGQWDWTEETDQEAFWENFRHVFDILNRGKKITRRISQGSVTLVEIADVGLGVQPYASFKHGKDAAKTKPFHSNRKLGPEYQPELRGENIERWHVSWPADNWLKYGKWLHCPRDPKFFLNDKVVLRQVLSDRLIVAIDREKYYADQSVFLVIAKPDSEYNVAFLAAVLGSTPMSYFYRQTFSEVKSMFPKLKVRQLASLPIPKIDFKKKPQKATHDALVTLADRMARLHSDQATAEQAFGDALDNHPHDWKTLGDTYWNREEYVALIGKKSHVKPNEAGAVTGFRCQMLGETIEIGAQVADGWKPVLDMTVVDQRVRLFILYGIHQFLRNNSRKRKWGEGKLLALTLETIQVPVFLSHGVHDVETQLRTLKLVLAEMKKHSPLLNPTELQRDITTTDEEIDRRVYDLYGLTVEERALVEASFARPKGKDSVAQQKI